MAALHVAVGIVAEHFSSTAEALVPGTEPQQKWEHLRPGEVLKVPNVRILR